MKSVSFVTSALFTRISNPPSAFTAFLNVSINKKKKLIFQIYIYLYIILHYYKNRSLLYNKHIFTY